MLERLKEVRKHEKKQEKKKRKEDNFELNYMRDLVTLSTLMKSDIKKYGSLSVNPLILLTSQRRCGIINIQFMIAIHQIHSMLQSSYRIDFVEPFCHIYSLLPREWVQCIVLFLKYFTALFSPVKLAVMKRGD